MTSTTFKTRLPVRLRVTGATFIAAWLHAVLTRQASRQALAALDTRLLRDVGLTREQAQREAAKPLWVD